MFAQPQPASLALLVVNTSVTKAISFFEQPTERQV
jgi:hypothetical protein